MELWNQYKTCGAKIISDVNERFMVFSDIIENCPDDIKIQTYLLTHYKAYKTVNDCITLNYLTNNHKILKELQNERISPQKELSKFQTDLLAFY